MSIASCYFACFVLFLAFVLYGPFVIVPLDLTLSTLFATFFFNLYYITVLNIDEQINLVFSFSCFVKFDVETEYHFFAMLCCVL